MPNNIIGERSTTPQNIVGILRNVGSGRGIASIDLDSGCHLVVTYTDGTTWTSDETLRGITATAVTDEYKLRITYEDGTVWESTQSIRGPVGPSTDTKVGELEDLTTVEKGTAVGAINELDAKGKKAADSAYQLLSKKTTEDTDPYLFRRTPEGVGDRADDTIVGGTVAWNQLIQNGNFESTSNWNTSQSTFSVANNEATIVSSGSGSYPQINQLKNVIVGHKYLMMVKGKSDDTINISFGSSAFVGQHRYQALSTSYTQYAKIYIGDRTVSGASFTISANNGADKSFVVKEANAIDLTQLFGTEIADYIYSLEQETAGAGVAWFKQYFPAEYYPYNAGELISVKSTAKVTRGFNQWDEEWELGYIDWSTGQNATSTTRIRSKNYIPAIGGETYYFNTGKADLYMYDTDKNHIQSKYMGSSDIYQIPANTAYIRFSPYAEYGTTYNNDICINLSDPDKNGTYEPYAGKTYLLGAEVRGLISLSNGKLAFNNGDIYTPDGKVKRKYLSITYSGEDSTDYIGSVYYDNGYFVIRPKSAYDHKRGDNYTLYNAICDKFVQKYFADLSTQGNRVFAVQGNWDAFRFYDSSLTSESAYKTWFSNNPTTIVYELATPVTEQSLPYDSPQVIFPEGTEQYVDDRTVPLIVGHITTYHTDMRNKLESLPDSTLEHWEVGSADQLTTKLGDTDQVPYLYRHSGGDLTVGTREYDTLVGGTVAENQLYKAWNNTTRSGVTFTTSEEGTKLVFSGTATAIIYYALNVSSVNNHVYFVDKGSNGAFSIYNDNHGVDTGESSRYAIGKATAQNSFYIRIGNGVEVNESIKPQIVDLTQKFGTTIADYVQSLTASSSGLAWLKKYGFVDGKYHAYNVASLVSVHPSAHKMVGFNQWDISTDNIDKVINNSGELITNNSFAVSNYIRVVPDASYYFLNVAPSANTNAMACYDANKNFIENISISGAAGTPTNGVKAMGANTHYIRVTRFKTSTEVCINLTKTTGSPKNGDYVPYSSHTYTLPDADLRGIFKLDSNNVPYCDGDTDDGSGTRTRRYGIVDLGTLDWTKHSTVGYFYATFADCKKALDSSSIPNIRTDKYETDYPAKIVLAQKDKIISVSAQSYQILVADSSYTNSAVFKAAMSGTYLVYEKDISVTEESTPFQNPQIVDPYGTEEYIDIRDVSVPVGHSTFYPKDLKRKLEELPDPPSGANGTYILKATINNGVTTYSWVVE